MLRTCLVLRGVIIVLATSASGYLRAPSRLSKPNCWFRTVRPLFSATASSILGESRLDYAGLMRRICEGLQPAVLQAKYDQFHPNVLIMNDPAHTMQHPYLSMNITEKADLVLADKEAPSCRTKPLFAVVTGMGRGKTRFCVELDWELKRRSNVVSIPITFNCFWSSFDTTFENRRVDYAVNIVSRMLSIHYGIRFPVALMLIQDVLLPMKSQVIDLDYLFPKAFIRAAVRHIVEQMSAAGRQVEHFVLIVDESKRAEEMLGKNAHDTLRSALLNTPIDYLDLQQQAIPNVHLVMTSLNLKATGVTSSGRTIEAISLPASLDAEEVFDRWVQRYVPEVSKLSEGAKMRIRFLIVMFATTPRAVEVLCGYLSDRYYGPDRTTNGGAAELESASFAQLFRDVQTALSKRYDDVNFVMPAKAFRGLLFNKDVKVDNTFLEGITNSVWTNAFAAIAPNVNVVPQTSIGAAYRQAVLVNEVRHYLYMLPVAEAVVSLLEHLNTPASGSEYVGNTLEIISKALINCRVEVNDAAGESLLLYELLRFDSTVKITKRCEPKLLLRLESPIISPSNAGYVKPELALSACNSYGKTKASNNKNAFLDKANDIIFDHESSVSGLHIELHKQECADGCWLLPTGRNPEDVIALFIDCKSGAIPDDEASANADDTATTSSRTKQYGWGDLPSREGKEPGWQARHLLKLADLATERNASSAHPGSLLDALRRGRFVYVYLRAQEGQTTFGVGDHVLQVGCSDMQTFLSFFLDLYKLVRTTCSGAMKSR